MKCKSPLPFLFLVLTGGLAFALGADDSGKPEAPAAEQALKKVQKLFLNGAGPLENAGAMQAGPDVIRPRNRIGGAQMTVAIRELKPTTAMEPPVIFLPGTPYLALPNPLAKWDPRHGYLGVVLEMEAEAEAEVEGGKKDAPKKITGVGIGNVLSDSPAEKAGIKEGDRVLTLEGKEAKNSAQLREMIRGMKAEQDVKLTVRREGKEMELKAKLAAAPEQGAGGVILGLNGNIVIGGLNANNDGRAAIPGVVTFPNSTSTVRNPNSTVQGVPTDKDSVTLRDGNRFLGKIRGMDPAKGLTLAREGQPDLELIEEEISAVTFAEQKKPEEATKPASAPRFSKLSLQLRDGSSVYGESLTMEKSMLRATLPGGQVIEIPQELAHSATLSDGQSAQIYDGPTGMAGWTSGRNNGGPWEYNDGVLRCADNTPIGRNLGRLPDATDLSFAVNFPRQMQQFGVMLFSSDVNVHSVGNLSVTFSPDAINASQYDGKRSNQYSVEQKGDGRAFFSPKSETVRYRILVDRAEGKVLIYVNGVKQADWKLSKVNAADFGKCGGTFSITPYASVMGTAFQLSHVRVLPWDGKEPEREEATAALKGDQTFGSDGVKRGGTIERITDSEVIFSKQEGKTPRAKTIIVRFAEPATPKESPAGVAMAQLRNGSELSAAKIRCAADTMTVTTRSGPEITLPCAALKSLDYLPRKGQADLDVKNLDVLTLSNGSQLVGRAILPFSETKVTWKIAASKAPLEYASENVAGIFFRGTEGARKTTPLKGDNLVRLGNGDWLPGDVVSLDATRLVMKTDVASEFIVRLSDTRAIYLNADAAATVADGATGPGLWSEGWKPDRSNGVNAIRNAGTSGKEDRTWRYFDGGYTVMGLPRNSQQTISRQWPPYVGAYALNFEPFTLGLSTYFQAQLFNSKNDRTFSVQASGTRIYVFYNPSSSANNRVAIGRPKQFQIEHKISGGKTHVSLVLDRPAKTFRVILNGKEVGKILFKEDEAKDALDASGVSLTTSYYSTSNSGRSRMENLWLAPWAPTADKTPATAAKAPGKTPDKEIADAPKPENAADSAPSIYLANGDDFSGTIDKITPELVTATSEAGSLEIPHTRIAWIHFPNCVEPVANHFPHLRFHDRGLLSVNDLRIGADRVQCKTLGGQPLDFPINVVKEVVWRPIAEK